VVLRLTCEEHQRLVPLAARMLQHAHGRAVQAVEAHVGGVVATAQAAPPRSVEPDLQRALGVLEEADPQHVQGLGGPILVPRANLPLHQLPLQLRHHCVSPEGSVDAPSRASRTTHAHPSPQEKHPSHAVT
jgi:hypothetical protein